MTASTSQVADCVAAYAARLQAVTGTRHQVASPLGAWLLLALAAPASSGADRETLTRVLGCDPGTAAAAAAGLLADPHPVVASAVAAWTAAGVQLGPDFDRWRSELPPGVASGDLPGQAGLDAWARDHTFGLIDRFPVQADSLLLVLASALATKVSWTVPFQLAPAASLGDASPWARQLSRVLKPQRRQPAATRSTSRRPPGCTIVHAAIAGGRTVRSVAAGPQVPDSPVLGGSPPAGNRRRQLRWPRPAPGAV